MHETRTKIMVVQMNNPKYVHDATGHVQNSSSLFMTDIINIHRKNPLSVVEIQLIAYKNCIQVDSRMCV